jgi:hypothetical protein
MKKVLRWISLMLLLFLLPCLVACAQKDRLVWMKDTPEKTTVRVNFANPTGVPLFKRQNVFSPSHSFVGSYMAEFGRDVPTLAALGAENQRADLFMGNGGVGATIGKGTPENLTYSWMQTDMTLRSFYKGGVMPYVVYFATPNGLYDKERAVTSYWKYPPVDMEGWSKVCAEIAAHYEKRSWPFAAHEIWNEPDWYDHSQKAMAFYEGTWEEYLSIYEHGVQGIRLANPYAMVGGMSLAIFSDYYSNGNVRMFLDHVSRQELPLDFISYHCYGIKDYPTYTRLANLSLKACGDVFASTALHMNEFHVAINSNVTATEKCIAPMMDAILFTLENPQITSVNWACFRVSGEDGIQVIQSRTGKRFAAYHLLSFYNRMPVDRVTLSEANGLKGVASIDGKQAGVLLYNRTYKTRDYVLALDNLPYKTCDITVYAIDENHSNYGRNGGNDEAEIVLSVQDVATENLCLKGELLTNGLIYVEIVPNGHVSELRPASAIDSHDRVLQGDTATVLRREYYFENRDTTMFSEFDLRTFTAWAGMGNSQTGLSKGAVVLRNLPAQLIARPSLTREAAQDTAVYLTAEYIDKDGNISHQQCYHHGINKTIDAQDIQSLPLNGEIVLTVPEGFDGVLKLSWGIMDGGVDTALKITFDKE